MQKQDWINYDILQLLAQRTAYVKLAGDLKARTTKIAIDCRRIANQERKIFDQSMELGLTAGITLPVFRAIMESSTQFQQLYIDYLL